MGHKVTAKTGSTRRRLRRREGRERSIPFYLKSSWKKKTKNKERNQSSSLLLVVKICLQILHFEQKIVLLHTFFHQCLGNPMSVTGENVDKVQSCPGGWLINWKMLLLAPDTVPCLPTLPQGGHGLGEVLAIGPPELGPMPPCWKATRGLL